MKKTMYIRSFMKKNMENYKQGDIVFVPFPHTNLKSKKFRPALVISNSSLKGDDVIVCGLSSQKPRMYGVVVNKKDLQEGNLPVISFVKVNKVLSLDRSIIRRKLAKISRVKMNEVIGGLMKIVRMM